MAKLRFRMKPKKGVHYLRRNGSEVPVRPGDVIECDKDEIKGALDKFEQLDPDPPPKEPKIGLKAIHRGHGNWDVINEATGEAINTEPLDKAEARKMEATWVPPGDATDLDSSTEKPEED